MYILKYILKISIIFFVLSMLFACAPIQRMVDVSPRHEHYHIAMTDTVQKIQVGEYLFREADLSILDGIELLTPAIAKSTSLLSPNFTLKPHTILVNSYSKGKYYYYVAKTKKGLQNHVMDALSEGLIGLRRLDYAGIRQLANTQHRELFAIAQEREYVYPLLGSVKWKKIELHAQDYAGSENSLIYLGKNNGKLAFGHKTYRHDAKNKNIFFSGSKSESQEKIIEIPQMQKRLVVDGRVIEIIDANNMMIQFKLDIDNDR